MRVDDRVNLGRYKSSEASQDVHGRARVNRCTLSIVHAQLLEFRARSLWRFDSNFVSSTRLALDDCTLVRYATARDNSQTRTHPLSKHPPRLESPEARRIDGPPPKTVLRVRTQLLKWIGNKQRFAHEIVGWFPEVTGTYYEPFVGSGAVLATFNPPRAVASDVLEPLIGIWKMVQDQPEELIERYDEHQQAFTALQGQQRKAWYLQLRQRYNAEPNAQDLLFLARSCYGGVIRFSKRGEMNTPMGPHQPVNGAGFRKRVERWKKRVANVNFVHRSYQKSLQLAGPGDLVYCDPPYTDSQSTLYGAQSFRFEELLAEIMAAKKRGARVALSIDGSKRSGRKSVDLNLPLGLFEAEILVNCGRSMLRRFQMEGQSLESEVVADRLLLTWNPPAQP